jgi:triacylglycerol lipase
MKKYLILLLIIPFLIAARGCNPPLPPPPPAHTPILFIHGWFGSPDNWDSIINRLVDAGYDRRLLFTIKQVDNFQLCSERHVEQVLLEIDTILEETGASKVDVVSHSRGGGVGYEVAIRLAESGKIEDWIALAGAIQGLNCDYASPVSDPTPGETLYTAIWSPDDGIIPNPSRWCVIEGAYNVELPGVKHVEFLTDGKVFDYLVNSLEGAGANN